MISGINLEIINYFKIVIVEKLITINKNKITSIIFFRLSIASSSNACYPNSTLTGYKTINTSSNTKYYQKRKQKLKIKARTKKQKQITLCNGIKVRW